MYYIQIYQVKKLHGLQVNYLINTFLKCFLWRCVSDFLQQVNIADCGSPRCTLKRRCMSTMTMHPMDSTQLVTECGRPIPGGHVDPLLCNCGLSSSWQFCCTFLRFAPVYNASPQLSFLSSLSFILAHTCFRQLSQPQLDTFIFPY